MGVKSLNTLISSYTTNGEKKIHLSKFKGYKLAIDTNVYLYKYLYGKSNHINGIFFMINKVLVTSPTNDRILDGVTRKSIITLAKKRGIKSINKFFNSKD